MSPQFVDFDADGQLDIVAGTFDGSPHLARGSAKGWQQPEQILDRDGKRIVLDQFWNFDTKKWDRASRQEGEEFVLGGGHATSAVAFDWDGDGDLDLLLGDHSSGQVHLRRNEGTREHAAFGKQNELVQAGGAPIDVPGTVATLRVFDWNRDGRLDLLASGMGDAYQDAEGGGVYLFLNTGTATATTFAAPLVLIERSQKGAAEPLRPDSGLYMDVGDPDGDGDLDLVVGGYSHWKPKARELQPEEQARVAELQQGLAAQRTALEKLNAAANAAAAEFEGDARDQKYTEAYRAQQPERSAIQKQMQALQKDLDALVPSARRESFVWLYENVTGAAPAK